MTIQMASGCFRLKSRFFDESKLVINKHRLAQTGQVSYPTVHKYIYREDLNGDYDIRAFSGEVLFAILHRGMGLTTEQMLDLRLGDVFEIVEEKVK